MIEAILFDIGNVILPFDLAPAIERLRARSAAQEPAAWDAFQRLKLRYESGGVDRAGFLAAARPGIGFAGDDAEFARIWNDIFTPNPAMDAFIAARAAERIPLYLLSNTNDLHVASFTANYPIFSRFHGAVYSHEERLMKPDEAIFRVAIDRFRLEPPKTLYVDDLAPNVETARRLGFAAVQYDHRTHAAFEKEFREWAATI